MTASSMTFSTAITLAIAWLNEAAMAAGDIASAYQTAETGMIPGQVCDTNRATWTGLAATNIGQNTPAMGVLDEQYGQYWLQNASLMGMYQAAVTSALAVLATPPPVAAPTGNPAVAAAAVGQVAADPAISALSQSGQGMTEALGGASGQAATPAAASTDMMGSVTPLMSTLTEAPQMLSEAPQAFSSLPQMFSQSFGQMGGLLGPLSGASSLGGAAPAADVASSLGGAGGGFATSGAGAGLNGLGSGIGGPTNAAMTAFTKPVNSFSPPSQPKLPGAWKIPEGEIPAPVSASPAAGGGGLYGAPSALARESSGHSDRAPTRTLQLTGRTTGNRGDDPRN
jgi:PPE-repeat protein